MAAHNQLGRWGENVAADFLEQQGYLIVERDWRHGHSDIDIVAFRDAVLVFVEVKTRSSLAYGQPYEAVDAQKIQHITAAADNYLRQQDRYCPWRFDIISIVGNASHYDLKHMVGAFTLTPS